MASTKIKTRQIDRLDSLEFAKVSTPANPSAGGMNLYFKSDSKLYKLDESGNETEIGAGGGSSYTFSTGLTNTSGTVTSNLSVGVSGGQSVIGGSASGNSLTLSSTSNATKGKILFGTSAYDEANNRLGIGTSSPTVPLGVIGQAVINPTLTETTATTIGLNCTNTLSPASNSSAQYRAIMMSNTYDAAGIDFSGIQSSAWFENRIKNINNATNTFSAISSYGVFFPINAATCGTINLVYGLKSFSFQTSGVALPSGSAITTAYAILASEGTKGTLSLTNSIGICIADTTQGTNNSNLLIGTTTQPSGTWSIYNTSTAKNYISGTVLIGTTTDAGYKLDINGTTRIQDNFTISDAKNIILGTSTGNKIGTATSQKIGFWNATPIVQPTTAVAAATLVGGGGTAITATDTFDGYTLQQIVKALRNTGLLA